MEEPIAKPIGKAQPAAAHAENLRQLVLKHKDGGKPFAIFAHAYPDPDAIGAMMGLNMLLDKSFGVESHLFYHGEVSHPQNAAIVNLLDPQLKRANEEYIPNNYGCRILVDTIPANAGSGEHKVDFDCVIDHHKDLPNGGYSGLVIHTKTGSCCSIVFKMMEQLMKDNWFDDDNDSDRKVATALMAGVVTDTDWMTSDDTTELESQTYSDLLEYRSPKNFRDIVFFKRSKFWIDTKAEAAREAEIDDEGYAIVGLGLIPEKDRDLIADMAGDILSWSSVETAVVFAVVGGDTLQGSVRSQNNSLCVPDFCKKLGGRCGTGGGKLAKGAYRYSLGGMCIDPDDDEDIRGQTWELIRKKETKRISKLIRK